MKDTEQNLDATKIAFKLEVEDDWPPFKVENLWLKKLESGYEVRNIPFFIENLAFRDLILISKSGDDLYEIEKILRRSGNSTLLALIDDESIKDEVLRRVKKLGCRYETGVLKGYYTINVPPEVDVDDLESTLEEYLTTEQVLLDYPFVYGEDS